MSQSPQPRTSVIISNLSKEAFVKQNAPLSLADSIKLAVLNLSPQRDILPSISHWSNLPFLNRIIIIFDTEEPAALAYDFLSKAVASDPNENPDSSLTLPESVKVSLQENLLQRSKSTDNINESTELSVTESLEKFRTHHNSGSFSDYQEPEPQPFDPALDLKRLGIDPAISQPTTVTSDSDKPANTRRSSVSGTSTPSLGQLGRSKSVTRTLFKPKPALNIQTATGQVEDAPASPTITLDELV